MGFFFLLPAYWLCGMLLYATSPRQQFIRNQGFQPPRWSAVLAMCVLGFSTVYLLTQALFTLPLALIFTLLGFMFFIPAPVFLLNHKPDWAAASAVFVCILAIVLELLGGA